MSNDLDNLLDMSLDDLADLPEFKVYNPGAHRVTIEFSSKKINEHPAVELKCKLLETVELADPSATPDVAGAECSIAFMLDNEFGQGKFKEVLKPLAAHFGVSRVPELIEACKGAECLIVTKVRQNKEKTQSYMDIVNIQVV